MKFHLTLQEANTLIDRAYIAGYIDDFIIHELTKRGIYEAWLAETSTLEGFKLYLGDKRYLYLDFVDDFLNDFEANIFKEIRKRIKLAQKCHSERNKVKELVLTIFETIVEKNSPKDLKDLKDCINTLAIIKGYCAKLNFSDSYDDVVQDLNNMYRILSMEG